MLAKAASAAAHQDIPAFAPPKESPSTSHSTKITLPSFNELPICRSPITIPSQPYQYQGHSYKHQHQQVHPPRLIRSNSISFPYVHQSLHLQHPHHPLHSVVERRHSYDPPSSYAQRVWPALPSQQPNPQVYYPHAHEQQHQPPLPHLTSSPPSLAPLSCSPPFGATPVRAPPGEHATYTHPPTSTVYISPPPSHNHTPIPGLRATKRQLKVLLEVFSETPTPTAALHDEIAERIGMSKKAIRNWFQNTRAKMRRLANQRAAGEEKGDGGVVGAGVEGRVQQTASPLDSGEEKEEGGVDRRETVAVIV
ncbi:hypothetical protein HDU98_009658 [Podochytrium sp. JEL0797]|nr:hypothetical protein HDU98_009658 [Podochytrium sp. JEL0797]